jgi:hypothetical protein
MRKPQDKKSGDQEKSMSEEKTIKVQQVPGGPFLDAVEVFVEESSEKWSEYKLSDGTKFRVRQVPLQVTRLVGQYDLDGNPLYFMKAQPIVILVEVPKELKKPQS